MQHELIRSARKAKRMTQVHLAIAAGVSARTVIRAEQGKPLTDENLKAICSVLDLDAASLAVDHVEPVFLSGIADESVLAFSPRMFAQFSSTILIALGSLCYSTFFAEPALNATKLVTPFWWGRGLALSALCVTAFLLLGVPTLFGMLHPSSSTVRISKRNWMAVECVFALIITASGAIMFVQTSVPILVMLSQVHGH